MRFIKYSWIYFIFVAVILNTDLAAVNKDYIIVDQNGNGDYTTITDAIKSLPVFNYGRVVILVKNGIYNEKFKIEQDYITIRGEDKEQTIIRFSQLREDWLKRKDTIGPGVVNILADDIILENLTIENTQPEIGPHAFAVYGTGTRTILLNCKLISKGSDTVSLWNYKTGMYYHSGCYFKGAVDFVCPRGWCFIKDSKFYEVKKTASLWHAGSYDKNQKFVIINSGFDGVNGFELGRHHYEAQFYFISCNFSGNLADKPIYRVTYNDSTKNRSFNWGKRYFYYNCHKENGDFTWFEYNLQSVDKNLKAEDITPKWTFNGKWDPESTEAPKIIHYEIRDKEILLVFNESITVINKPELKSGNNTTFKFHYGGENNTLSFIADKGIIDDDLTGLKIVNDGRLIGSIATVKEREVSLIIIKRLDENNLKSN